MKIHENTIHNHSGSGHLRVSVLQRKSLKNENEAGLCNTPPWTVYSQNQFINALIKEWKFR